MSHHLAYYEKALSGLERVGRRRELTRPMGIDFTSNDYLGLANSDRIRDAVGRALDNFTAVGSGGSRLLRGNHPEHEALEKEASLFFGAERAMYFSSGYCANAALFSTLPRRDDLIVYDALIHASALQGICASRATSVFAMHNDAASFDDAIRAWRLAGGKGRPWIAIESLYSMDGNMAPLPDLAQIAARHDGFLVIDEAHATGVFGPKGRGLAAGMAGLDNVIILHTCGKALGVCGALVCASSIICDYLANRAAGFIYTTAPSPLLAAAVRESLRILSDEPERRAALEHLCVFANAQTALIPRMKSTRSQILPLIIGDNRKVMRIARSMRGAGFDIRAIRPPTVPVRTARLRISITLGVDMDKIAMMFHSLRTLI